MGDIASCKPFGFVVQSAPCWGIIEEARSEWLGKRTALVEKALGMYCWVSSLGAGYFVALPWVWRWGYLWQGSVQVACATYTRWQASGLWMIVDESVFQNLQWTYGPDPCGSHKCQGLHLSLVARGSSRDGVFFGLAYLILQCYLELYLSSWNRE